MGQTLRAMHEPRQALPFLLRDTQLAPADAEGARALAAAMQEANEFSEDSVRFLAKLAESGTGGGEVWYRLGLLTYQNGYYAAALDDLDKALRSMTIVDRNAAESARAICLMQVGRAEEAEQAFRGLIAQPANAKNLDLLLGYARVLYESGRYDPAMQMADRAVAADSGNASAHFWRARILLQEPQDHLKEAATEAERARDLSPGSPAPRNLLIRIYQKQGRSEDAAREADWVRQHEKSPDDLK
jgi:tetratricopeptide (TPR) repeat protein